MENITLNTTGARLNNVNIELVFSSVFIFVSLCVSATYAAIVAYRRRPYDTLKETIYTEHSRL